MDIITNKPIKNIKRFNERFILLLGKLNSVMNSIGEKRRASAYKKAQESIILFPDTITDIKQIKDLENIGKGVMTVLSEYMETGKISKLEKYEKSPIYIFSQIYGVGPKKAREIVEKHKITTIEELRENTDILNAKQIIGLKYYENILERIPREEIAEFEKILNKYLDSLSIEGSKLEIVGSYRRGFKDSGDIDVIITNSDDDNSSYKLLVDKLIEDGKIVEILSRGKVKTLCIGRLNDSLPFRRLDFLYSPPQQYAFAKLYFTGSASFNVMMRRRALDMGFTMNEHGITSVDGKPIEMDFDSEKDIFKFLDLKYTKPEKRLIGNMVYGTETPKTTIKSKTPKSKMKTPKTKDKMLKSKMKDKTPKSKAKTPKSSKITKEKIEKKNKEIDEMLKSYSKDGISFLSDLSEKQLENLLKRSNDLYYNKKPLISDELFDVLKDNIEERYPDNIVLKMIGAPVKMDINKVELPYYMGSMDKMKPDTKVLDKWIKKYKGPYVISTKLDGVSALYYNEDGSNKLYTRGNGTIGQDISHLIPYLSLPLEEKITIRGEIILSKEIFEEKYKYKTSNARNFVSGIVNSKTLKYEKINDIDFVAYEVIYPEMKPKKQFELMNSIDNLNVAYNKTIDSVSNSILSEYLETLRSDYEYEIDGIIVTNNKFYERVVGENPKHSIAFKMVLSDQVAESIVLDVIWTPSMHGYLKPRVKIQKTNLSGVNIEYITGNNAKYIKDNKIGPGAIVKFIRSGDVIPKIMEVMKPAEKGGKMPDKEYKWNKTGVDILLVNQDVSVEVLMKRIEKFFKVLETPGMGPGIVKRLVSNGFDSIKKILNMKYEDLIKIDGFKDRSVKKILGNIKNAIDDVDLPTLMVASNVFGRGFGKKKIDLIMIQYPDILISEDQLYNKIEKVKSIPGIGGKTAPEFVSKIKPFIDFVSDNDLGDKLIQKIEKELEVATGAEDHPLYGLSVLFTGFRDKELEKQIKSVGGVVESSFKNSLDILVKKEEDTSGSKVDKAVKKGIRIITREEFVEEYMED